MYLFIVNYMAYKRIYAETSVASTSGLLYLFTDNTRIAQSHAIQTCWEIFPSSAGWSNHSTTATLVPATIPSIEADGTQKQYQIFLEEV